MKKYAETSLRMGIVSESAFCGALRAESHLLFSAGAYPDLVALCEKSGPMTAQLESNSCPISESFQTVGSFSALTEPFWKLDLSPPFNGDTPLVANYHHSQTPVRYERLDDLLLTYQGSLLERVDRESGDSLTLEYDSEGKLISVANTYTNTTKKLSYAGEDLVRVVTESS